MVQKDIQNFIENKLVELIRKDLSNFQIGIERDFESLLFHHLRNFLEKKYPQIKISTNFSIIGVKIWKWGKNPKTKKKEWKKSTFVQPDVVLSKIKINQKKPISNHKIAFELKVVSPSVNSSPTFNSGDYHKDFRKLNKLKQDGFVDKAYFFVICSSLTKSEDEIVVDIENAEFEDGKNRKRKNYPKCFTSLVINRYTDPKKKTDILTNKSLIKKIQNTNMVIWRSYEDGEMPERRQAIMDNPNMMNNSLGATRAWETRRKRDQLSIKKYGKEFNKLSDSKKTTVKEILKLQKP